MSDDRPLRRPVILDPTEARLPDPGPDPDPGPGPDPRARVGSEPDSEPTGDRRPRDRSAAERGLLGLPRLGGLFWPAALGLVALALGTAAADFVLSLFERAGLLGWLGALLLAAALIGLALGIRDEAQGARRLARARAVRTAAAAEPVPRILDRLDRHYSDRAELRVVIAELRRDTDGLDRADALPEIEARLLGGLDRSAREAVTGASRSVAVTTALVSLPLIDVAAVLWLNVRMIRRVAEIYCGRAGWLGSLRLLRLVAESVLAAGAVSTLEDVAGPLVGGGMAGAVSRRVGEAAINAALTARVGDAAITVCRPLPRTVEPKGAAVASVLGRLTDWLPMRGARTG